MQRASNFASTNSNKFSYSLPAIYRYIYISLVILSARFSSSIYLIYQPELLFHKFNWKISFFQSLNIHRVWLTNLTATAVMGGKSPKKKKKNRNSVHFNWMNEFWDLFSGMNENFTIFFSNRFQSRIKRMCLLNLILFFAISIFTADCSSAVNMIRISDSAKYVTFKIQSKFRKLIIC